MTLIDIDWIIDILSNMDKLSIHDMNITDGESVRVILFGDIRGKFVIYSI